ncbi:MAG TPA: TetR/AcrR family transcriptional regulator [Herpetosiphonaceae bacterium]|nr:TetR/AcrR family transcriptional regulator [Herpetosiphonaceae bacterium]
MPGSNFPAACAADAEGRKERRDAAEHRQAILAKAQELFRAHGIEATSMCEIAREAGVGQGTLYRRFAHKGALCEALLAEQLQDFRATTTALIDASADAPALEQLEHVIRQLLTFYADNEGLVGAMMDAAAGVRQTSFFESSFYAWSHDLLAYVLERGIEQGQIAPLDSGVGADMVLAALNVDFYRYMHATHGLSNEQLLQTIQRLVIDGLRVRTAPPAGGA